MWFLRSALVLVQEMFLGHFYGELFDSQNMNSPTSDSLIEATSDLELCLFKIGELTVL